MENNQINNTYDEKKKKILAVDDEIAIIDLLKMVKRQCVKL